MAILKGNKHKMSGKSGDYLFRQVGNETIVSQRPKQTVNRTVAAMKNKVKRNNIMAMRRVLKADEMERFEGVANLSYSQGQYVKVNSDRNVVYLHSNELNQGGCVLVAHQISAGSLPSIQHSYVGGNKVVTDIKLMQEITAETTVGAFATDLLHMNTQFMPGDVLTLYFLRQVESADTQVPFVKLYVHNIEVNPMSGILLSKVMGAEVLCVRDGYLSMKKGLAKSAMAFVHKRHVEGRSWRCSTQVLICHNPLVKKYATEDAFRYAASAYGKLQDESLTPNENDMAKYVVSAFSNDDRLGSVSGAMGVFAYGDELVLTATPAPGAIFTHWTDHAGNRVGEDATLTLRVMSNESFVAHFAEE